MTEASVNHRRTSNLAEVPSAEASANIQPNIFGRSNLLFEHCKTLTSKIIFLHNLLCRYGAWMFLASPHADFPVRMFLTFCNGINLP